jgi:hypothetical protein
MSMKTEEIRSQIKNYADKLSDKNINTVYEFMAYLADKESEKATQELLEIPGLLTEIEQAKKDIEGGKVINFEQLKRKF